MASQQVYFNRYNAMIRVAFVSFMLVIEVSLCCEGYDWSKPAPPESKPILKSCIEIKRRESAENNDGSRLYKETTTKLDVSRNIAQFAAKLRDLLDRNCIKIKERESVENNSGSRLYEETTAKLDVSLDTAQFAAKLRDLLDSISFPFDSSATEAIEFICSHNEGTRIDPDTSSPDLNDLLRRISFSLSCSAIKAIELICLNDKKSKIAGLNLLTSDLGNITQVNMMFRKYLGEENAGEYPDGNLLKLDGSGGSRIHSIMNHYINRLELTKIFDVKIIPENPPTDAEEERLLRKLSIWAYAVKELRETFQTLFSHAGKKIGFTSPLYKLFKPAVDFLVSAMFPGIKASTASQEEITSFLDSLNVHTKKYIKLNSLMEAYLVKENRFPDFILSEFTLKSFGSDLGILHSMLEYGSWDMTSLREAHPDILLCDATLLPSDNVTKWLESVNDLRTTVRNIIGYREHSTVYGFIFSIYLRCNTPFVWTKNLVEKYREIYNNRGGLCSNHRGYAALGVM